MKQKNHNWIIYGAIFIILAAVLYVAVQDITPISHHVETVKEINFKK